jgi:hypothetical protein
MEHKRGNEAYIILHRGARSRGYKRRERARARARARERVPACCLSRLPRVPVFPLCQRVSTSANVCQRALGRPWTSPFIDTRRCPAVQWGCSYVLTWLAEKRLEPCTRVLTWLSEKRLEPCRRIARGAAWILLTFPFFCRRLRSIRRHGRTRGTIITCCRSNLRWDTGLVLS